MNTIRIVATASNGNTREVTYEIPSPDVLQSLFVTLREQAWAKSLYATQDNASQGMA